MIFDKNPSNPDYVVCVDAMFVHSRYRLAVAGLAMRMGRNLWHTKQMVSLFLHGHHVAVTQEQHHCGNSIF